MTGMDEREQEARARGDIKVFLHTEEAAVMFAALALLKSELLLADEHVPSLKSLDARMRIPPGLFRSLDDVIDRITARFIAQCEADFTERGDEDGVRKFHETIHERWEWHSQLMELMQLVLMSAYGDRDAI